MPDASRKSAAPAGRNQLPSSPLIRFLRWWLPGIVILAGVLVAVVNGFDEDSLDGASAIIGAGSSLWLMNFLWRIGVVGDRARDKEDDARAFFDRNGYWPDEEPSQRRR